VLNPIAKPALFISKSIFLKSLGKLSIALQTSSLERISKFKQNTFAFDFASISDFKSSNLCLRLPVKIKLYPFSDNNSAVAFPIPDVAPDIKAVFFIFISLKIIYLKIFLQQHIRGD